MLTITQSLAEIRILIHTQRRTQSQSTPTLSQLSSDIGGESDTNSVFGGESDSSSVFDGGSDNNSICGENSDNNSTLHQLSQAQSMESQLTQILAKNTAELKQELSKLILRRKWNRLVSPGYGKEKRKVIRHSSSPSSNSG